MAGRGTGVPIAWKCPKCRRRHWRTTGRTRRLYGRQAQNGPPRTLGHSVQYECLGCGHVGWSRHQDMERARDAETEQRRARRTWRTAKRLAGLTE